MHSTDTRFVETNIGFIDQVRTESSPESLRYVMLEGRLPAFITKRTRKCSEKEIGQPAVSIVRQAFEMIDVIGQMTS